MKTTEIRLDAKKYKLLSTLPYGRYHKLSRETDDNIDIVVSTLAVDESNAIYAELIGEKVDCPIQLKGKGCHIRILKYPNNTPVLAEMLRGFMNGVKYRTEDTNDKIEYRYGYLWFERPKLEDSVLTKFFKEQSQTVSFMNDIIYIVPIKHD